MLQTVSFKDYSSEVIYEIYKDLLTISFVLNCAGYSSDVQREQGYTYYLL